MTGERILVWGAGAIGGTLAAYWARAGHDVTLVDVVAEHAQACRTDGLAIEGPVASFVQCIAAFTPAALAAKHPGATWPIIVLAVKAQATEAASAQLRPFLAPDGFVLSAQNGLNELAIADAVGPERTMGAFVNFGADWLGPGQILYGNRGAVVVGEIDGAPRERTRAVHALLRAFEPDAVLTDNIWGYLWGKLAYGAMLFATALTPDTIADSFADPAREAALIALGREVMAVAQARGVVAVGFNGFDPARFAPEASLAGARASIAALEAFNRPNAKTHSGVWRDIAVRRRPTEVDAQIAIIDRLGGEAGVDTPVIRRLVALVHDVEEGRRPQSAETFGELMRP